MSRVSNIRRELILWQVAEWMISFVPLAVVLIINRGKYFEGYSGVRVSCGVGVVLAVSLMVALKKVKWIKLPGALWGIVLILWLLQSVLADMVLLTFVLACGVSAGEIIEAVRVRPLEEKLRQEQTKETVQAAVEAALAGKEVRNEQ